MNKDVVEVIETLDNLSKHYKFTLRQKQRVEDFVKQEQFLFAEWINKNAKPAPRNQPFIWKIIEGKLDGSNVYAYVSTEELYKKYLTTNQK